MYPTSTHLPPILVTGLALVLLATAFLVRADAPPETARDPIPSIAFGAADTAPTAAREPQDAVIAPVFVAPTQIPPTPTPVPASEPSHLWVRTANDSAFVPAIGVDSDEDGSWELPASTYLKVLNDGAPTIHVFFGGDGDELDPIEGWISSADVQPSPAPLWVATIRPAALRSTTGPSLDLVAGLPAGAVLEVAEDLGPQLRVFYLGDGLVQDPMEGWVSVDDVGPAGAVLAGGAQGVRLLRSTDFSSFSNGTGAWLRVPYRTQLDGSRSELSNCGPASVGMVISAFGRHAETHEIRAVAEQLQGTTDPDYGFAIEFLEGALWHFGVAGRDLLSGKDLRRWSLEEVRSHIREGRPVIPQLRFRLMPGRSEADYSEDHYVVLTGFIGDDFIYNDPVNIDGPGYGRLMDAETLERAWGGSYFPFAAFAAGPS